jgi:hypothetical protein
LTCPPNNTTTHQLVTLQVLPAVNKVVSLFNNRNKQPALRSLLQVGLGSRVLPDSILGVSTGNSMHFAESFAQQQQQQQPLQDGQRLPGATALPAQMTPKGAQQLQSMIGAAQNINKAPGGDAFNMAGYNFQSAGDGIGFDFTIIDDMLGPINGPSKPADTLESGSAAGSQKQSVAEAMLPSSGLPGLENYYAGYTSGTGTLAGLLNSMGASINGGGGDGAGGGNSGGLSSSDQVLQLQQPQQQYMMQQQQALLQKLQQPQQQQPQQQQQQLLQQPQQQMPQYGPDLAAIQNFQLQRQQQHQHQRVQPATYQPQQQQQQQQQTPAATLESAQQPQQQQQQQQQQQPKADNAAAAAAAEPEVVVTPGYPPEFDPTTTIADPTVSSVIYYNDHGKPSAHPLTSSSSSHGLSASQTGSSSSSSSGGKLIPYTWATLGLDSKSDFPASTSIPASTSFPASSMSSSAADFGAADASASETMWSKIGTSLGTLQQQQT